MKPTWILAGLTLVGCQQIFGLEDPTLGLPHDAAPGDGFADVGPCLDVSRTCTGSNTLRSCDGAGGVPTETTCAWGCDGTSAEGRCYVLAPSGGLLGPANLTTTAAVTDIVINSATPIYTDTGQIGTIRAAGSGVISGIGFEPHVGGGVFTMRTLTLSAPLVAFGTRPLAIVALDGLTISSGGTLDLRGACSTNAPGAGGGPGGTSGQPASPLGGQGGGNSNSMGGGGGGHGGPGGTGGNGGAGAGPAGGPTYGTALIATLVGGRGGGGGGDLTGGGVGGGGGGAVQIVSNGAVIISSSGAINAGGCGGKASTSNDSGGGGGAGGAILIEAVAITVHGTLAVNGGGGGGAEGGTSAAGENGAASRVAAAGGSSTEGAGGDGAAGAVLNGATGQEGGNAGGGGGGIGRMRLNTRDGSVTVGNAGVMSPGLGDANTTATQGTAAVQ